MKKLVCYLLLAAMACGAFTACSNSSGGNGDESNSDATSTTAADSASETDPTYTLGVPESLDYDGYVFRFLTNPGENKTTESQFLQFSYDTENGDIYNDALYKRNEYVKEYLNIGLETLTSGGLTDVSAFRRSVDADDDSFDIGIWIDRFALSLAQEGKVIPINDLANMYIDLKQPWWLEDVNKELTIDNKLYFAGSAYDMSIYGNLQILLYNKTMADNLQLDNMYDMVRNGTWTISQMYEYMKKGTADLNGNTQQEPEDRWGFCWIENFCDFATSGNNDVYFIQKDENDLPYFSAPGNERLIAVCDAIAKMMKDKNYAIQVDKIPGKYKTGHVYENVVTMFASGNSLFAGSGSFYLNNLREMTDEFGILPFPKYEAVPAGTPYKSWLFGVLGYIVPVTINDPEMASAVLETIAYASYEMVVPEYLNTILALKRVRDDDSAEMLNMLSKNFCIDLAHTYFLDCTNTVHVGAFTTGADKFASTAEKSAEKIQKQLDKTIEAFSKLGN